jgi:hypothetical protein
MGLKRAHTDAEIEAMAEKFRESWSEGQVIRSWLRNHSAELRKLVREEDWSWTNVGKALSVAGIQFKTNKGWTGENVRRAVDLATKSKKARPEKASAPGPSSSGPSFVPAAPPPSRPAGEPEFKIIQRGPGSSVTSNRNGGE